MEFLPLFFDLKQSTALVFGDTDAAARKAEVLTAAGCLVQLVAESIHNQGFERLSTIDLFSHHASTDDSMWSNVHLVVAATGSEEDQKISDKAKSLNLPINVVNRPDISSFIFPSIIDRSPVIAAVSSSGELPVLTRLLRSRIEASIPHAFGRLAMIAKKFRPIVKSSIV